MHKSLKNFITVREILDRYDPEVLRLYYASTHYRKPIEFKEKDLEESRRELEYFYNTLRNIKNATAKDDKEPSALKKILTDTKKKFAEAMNNDFNTSLALTHLHALARKANSIVNKQRINPKLSEEIIQTMKDLGKIFAILEKDILEEIELPEKVKELIVEREEARIRKDWEKGDAIREQIRNLGYIIEDTTEGTRWKKI